MQNVRPISVRWFEIVLFLGIVIGSLTGMAEGSPAPPEAGIQPWGYLSFNYLYMGSASSQTVYHGLRLNGNLRLEFFHRRMALVFRSRHYWHFQKTEAFLYDRSFHNRQLIRDVYLEIHDILRSGTNLRLGRFYPSVAASVLYPTDGLQVESTWHRVKFRIAGGLPIDAWNNHHLSGGRLIAGSVSVSTPRILFSLGGTILKDAMRTSEELAADLQLQVSPGVWLSGGGAYDIQVAEAVRMYGGITVRRRGAYFSLSYHVWKNPWEQLHFHDIVRSLPFFGRNAPLPPVEFQDIRGQMSWRLHQWQLDVTVARFLGVRSGWMSLAWIRTPRMIGFHFRFGGRAIRSDSVNFYALGGALQTRISSVAIEIYSEARVYQRLPTFSGFRYGENLSEITVTFPFVRHWYLRMRSGAYFRDLGDEPFKPFAEFHLLYRF